MLLGLNPRAYEALVVRGAGGHAEATEMMEAIDVLSMTRPEELFASPVRVMDEARLALAGLWLWHDALEASHEICQSIETSGGSYWHAIVHRRESDFPNARYWLRRAGGHGSFGAIAARVGAMISELPVDKGMLRLVSGSGAGARWDPVALVDLVEEEERAGVESERRRLVVELQRAEWRALFEHNVRAAVGAIGRV
jgi:hypothetical protein